MKRNIFFMATVVMTLLMSCSSKEEKKEENGKYTVTSPITMDTVFSKEFVSQIRSIHNIELRAQEKGYLEKILVDEGQYVTQGQILFRIMPSLYQAELLKAQAELKEAEIEWQNARSLADKNIVSKSEQAIAQAKVEKAKAEVSLAKLHLSFTEIRAPFSGTIDRIPLKLGSLIEEGELLTTLSDNSQIFAYFNVSEPEYLDYQTHINDRADSKVKLLLANGEWFKYQGNFEVVESEFNSETGNIAFRAKFPNAEKLLKNGETGKVVMTVPLKNALLIPQKATYEIQDKIFVFVVNKNNNVTSREIEIQGELPDLYVVKEGLTEKDRIVLDGLQNVKDGDHIEFSFQDPKHVLNHLKLKAE